MIEKKNIFALTFDEKAYVCNIMIADLLIVKAAVVETIFLQHVQQMYYTSPHHKTNVWSTIKITLCKYYKIYL